MAATRNSIAGLGFVVARSALLLEQIGQAGHRRRSHIGLSTITDVVVVLSGGGQIAFGCQQHTRARNVLCEGGAAQAGDARWPLVATVVAVAGAVILAVLVIISTAVSA